MSHAPYAILTLPAAPETRARFMSPLASDEWEPLRRSGLPPGWQLLLPGEVSRELVAAIPVLFDSVGPVDLRPALAAWEQEGRLRWDHHPEIEQATECVNCLLAAKLQERFDLQAAVPLPAPAEALPEKLLPTFAKTWQDYEVRSADLFLADQAEQSQAEPWFGSEATRHAWQAYTRAVRRLKGVCRRILRQARRSQSLPIYLPAGQPMEVSD